MLPANLQPDSFSSYPPAAKQLALAHLSLLQVLPLSFLPSLLRELIEYDYKFPAERAAANFELNTLNALTSAQLQQWFQGFSRITVPAKLEHVDWVNAPALFVQEQSAFLWSSHQLDAFRKAAADYGNQLRAANPVNPIPINRLGIVVLGQGVDNWTDPLFRNLRPHGTFFKNVNAAGGLDLLRSAVDARATAHPAPYAHWYIDGSHAKSIPGSPLTQISYADLKSVRAALLKQIDAEVDRPGMGPEELRAYLSRLSPSDLKVDGGGDPVVDHFQVKILTEGSGTQLFSTSFIQWTTRELLRRAQPLTLMARFTPRQRQRPMNELLSNPIGESNLDPQGSIVDADMSAYYHWINQQRLPGSERSAFLVWYEGHSQALVISPTLPRGTESQSALNLRELLSLATG